MATVRIGSVPALHLGGLPDRLRAFVVANSRAITLIGIPLVLVSLGLLLLTPRAGIGEESAIDYQVYRWAVHTWLAGGDIMNTAPTVSIGRVLPWVYPPFALAPLAPLALLPFSAGLLALYLLDLLAIGGSLYLVLRHLWPAVGARGALAAATVLLPLTLFLEPVYSSFGLGQVNILLMGLVMADCLAESPRWPRGLLIGIAAAIKLTPAAFLLFLVLRKDYRAAVVAVGTAVVATLSGFALNRSAAVEYWFGKGPAHGVSGSAFHTNQSIMGALSRFELPAAAQNGFWLLLAIAVTLAVGFAVRRVEPVLAVSANALLALLISPTSWSDHWVWCAPGLLVLLGYAVRLRSVGWLAVAGWTLVTVLAAAFNWMPSGPPWDVVAHLFGNPYALLGLVLIGLLVRKARREPIRPEVPRASLPEPAGV
ncbi:glycosyltransferase family 87 protein [Saccharopolyspora sp. TS4A08]|uniref:Glycosyltransferase family 87 protein n=1 Tax=Saccharopolyspora ipomoeae TaxID=3042027 RepID=A0ABT6PWN6_9PSEU|nr:glycosyltransferase family 87 protein [Saccharopolyspora sp. TS4A08]MDI2032265.1 glycosyltransferase family 87 protein [Saccharopolyspora sp. TS4A08]